MVVMHPAAVAAAESACFCLSFVVVIFDEFDDFPFVRIDFRGGVLFIEVA